MKIFGADYLSDLGMQAKASPRRRQHANVHQNHQEPCQRLFNAIEPGSYIRPHRHASDPRDELLVAIRGLMAVLVFNDAGAISEIVHLGVQNFGMDTCCAVEMSPFEWHTVISLEPGCVLLEIKAGPFDANRPKDLAPWAPEEGTVESKLFLSTLVAQAQMIKQHP